MKFEYYKNAYSETYYKSTGNFSDQTYVDVQIKKFKGKKYLEVISTNGYNSTLIGYRDDLKSAKRMAIDYFNKNLKKGIE